MKRFAAALYGMQIGFLCAVGGGVIFSIFASLLMFRFLLFSTTGVLGISYAILYSTMFSAVPGVIGGAYLAHWLEQGERTPAEIRLRGLLAGGASGLLAAVAAVAVLFDFYISQMTVGLSALAIVIATLMGWLGARWLATRIKRNA